MTPQFSKEALSNEAFAALGGPNLVYVRPVKAADVLASTPVDQARNLSIKPDQILYAVHSADGERLAILEDKQTAVATAIANELAPVSVH
ncbi:MAG: DUF1150 family protein [Caulobacterales bacterium]